MNINWSKFWTEQLPFCFRKVRILALISALCTIISRLWSEWTTWGERARQRAAYTWQVYWLERLVWLEMGVVIIIEPADGRPFDFVVNVSSITSAETYDENRLRGLIDRYKLAGKSYRIVDSAIVREVRFIEHLCEKALQIFKVEFIAHRCEKANHEFQIRFINHFCEQYNNREINMITLENYDNDYGEWIYVANAQKPVASDIEVYIYIGDTEPSPILIRKGAKSGQISSAVYPSNVIIFDIKPQYDDTYTYEY